MIISKKQFLALVLLTISGVTNAQTTEFEGELMYENTVTSSKGMRKLYPSLLKDGTYDMQYVIKGNNRKTADTYSGLIQYENRDRDLGYVYSPVLKKGFKFKIKEYEAKLNEKVEKNGMSEAKNTGETKEIEGFKCYHYKGNTATQQDLLGAKIEITCTMDYWVCMDFRPEFIGSIKVPGLPVSFDEMQVASFPLLGSQKQHQNVQLTAANRRPVDKGEVTPPSGINYTFSEDPISDFYKLQKEVYKYLKKNKITDNGVKINHGKTEEAILDDAWD